jgi:hypothetical protein
LEPISWPSRRGLAALCRPLEETTVRSAVAAEPHAIWQTAIYDVSEGSVTADSEMIKAGAVPDPLRSYLDGRAVVTGPYVHVFEPELAKVVVALRRLES